MPKIFQVGNMKVEPGDKQCGRVEIGRRPDGSQIYIPVMIANGAGDGPALNVSSGCHGDEYEGSVAIRRWWKALDPQALRGVFLGVPVINVLAYEAGTRQSWIDHTNLNRVYPGNPTGFITERLAHIYLNEVVYKADMVMDLHGGGNIQIMGHQVIWRTNPGGPEVTEKAFKLAKATGWKYIWKGSGTWGGTVTIEALKKGIPALTVEAGGEGRCLEPIVQDFEKLIGNVMKTYKMIDGQPETADKLIMFQGSFLHCNVGGLYTQKVGLHERVKEGQELATIEDLFGEVVETIRAPFDGIVSSKRTFPTVNPGDWALQVGRIVED